jgi:uncharacterized protein
MKNTFLIFILSLLFSSCISYHVTEKDLFKINKVSKLNNNVSLEEVYFTTSDSVKLCGWFIKHKDSRGTLLYFGGDGFYLWNRLTPDVINVLTSLKMNLMLIDYRGYGRSEGEPSVKGIYEDGSATYKYLCSRKDIDSTRIILYGHSLGTFVAVHLANNSHTAGVVLEGVISSTTEMKDVALENNAPWYLRWLVNIDADSIVTGLDNLKQMPYIRQPLLVITGEKDNIAPPQMAQRVYQAAASSVKRFEIVPNGEHKDLYFSNKDGRRDYYNKALSNYLDSVLGTQ